MKKGALFDMDGTLFDTERVFRESWKQLAKEYGVEYNPEFPFAVCGTSGDDMLAVIRKYFPTIDDVQFKKDCYDRVHKVMNEGAAELLMPGVLEILEYFQKNGVKMAIASSSYHDQIYKNIVNAKIDKYFEAIIGGDDIENAKPHPEIFQKAAAALGLEARDCYAVEDGMNGIKSGAAAGAATIMVVDMTPANDEARQLCAGIYDSLGEMLDAIKAGEI